MWIRDKENRKIFSGGRSDWAAAAGEAACCPVFRADDEDEWVADEAISCYNCRYRRWTIDAFICMKG